MNANEDSASRLYTVVAIYQNNLQRYATNVYGPSPMDARRAVEQDRINDGCSVYVCAVFEGEHKCVDTNAEMADKPPHARSRPRSSEPYTVVCMDRHGDVSTCHVTARSPELAESIGANHDDELVAGVFKGHLINVANIGRHDVCIPRKSARAAGFNRYQSIS